MGWEHIATPEAVELAERAILAALATWSDGSDERFGIELEQVVSALPSEEARTNVLTCAVAIAGIALVELTGGYDRSEPRERREAEHLRRTETIHLAALVLRALGDAGGGSGGAGVREPRRPRPHQPSAGASPPGDQELD